MNEKRTEKKKPVSQNAKIKALEQRVAELQEENEAMRIELRDLCKLEAHNH